jgi:hypothetical protein
MFSITTMAMAHFRMSPIKLAWRGSILAPFSGAAFLDYDQDGLLDLYIGPM